MKRKFIRGLFITDPEFIPKDKWIRILGIPFVGILLPWIFCVVNPYFNENFLAASLICIFYTFIHWQGNRYLIIKLRYLYQDYSLTGKRITLQLIFMMSFTAFVNFGLCYLINVNLFDQDYNYDFALVNFKISIIATFFIATIYECFYIFNRWEKAIIESEKLKRENLISQFETLKNQVNPHFLFNSLNTLITVIPENTELAVEFVQKLANVYRYVLNNKDKELVTVETELDFVKDYVFLIRIRFSENLSVDFKIPQSTLNTHIAPLTLQMLIENAIKHNIISSEKPLYIKVFQENENWLAVENNLQRKSVPVESTQIGLQNIINRYKYLNQKMVEIIETTNNFKVSLPLLTVETDRSFGETKS